MRRQVAKCIFAAVAVLGTCTAALAQDKGSNAGELLYNNACRTCHTTKEGDNRLGPTLYKIIGQKAGSVAGYEFSPTMKNAGIVWDEKNLDQFIADPEAFLPGNNMKPFTGISSAEERAKIIAFLKTAE